VSHIWLTPSSPDPHGHTLRLVCCALRTMLATELAPAIGVFVCASSMLQSDPVLGLERSAADESLFEAALRGLPLLCGHPHTWVLRVTTFPDDYPAAYSIPLGANVAKPEARGWLQAEAAWVSMKPSGHLVLDLGKLDGSEADFASMFRKCGAARRPPPRPAELAARLEHAKFTDGERDRPLVASLYASAFPQLMGGVISWQCAGCFWGDAEAAAVANLISGGALPNLTHLNLGSNGIGPAGVGALADAISQGGAPNLVEISLADNLGLGEGSTVALVEAVATRGGRLIL